MNPDVDASTHPYVQWLERSGIQLSLQKERNTAAGPPQCHENEIILLQKSLLSKKWAHISTGMWISVPKKLRGLRDAQIRHSYGFGHGRL